MKIVLVNILFILFLEGQIYSQRNDTWVFGYNSGLDFKTIPPTLIHPEFRNKFTNYHKISDDWSDVSSSISDCNGDLLFYTSGCCIWNKLFQPMSNGVLMGDCNVNISLGVDQNDNVLIVPKPGDIYKYYVFSSNGKDYPDEIYNGIYYSEVDMTLNGGLGAVDSFKNNRLTSLFTPGIVAIPHQNNVDWWLVTKPKEDSFYVFLITNAGINNIPIVSYGLGNNYISSLNWRNGIISTSHDFKNIAVSFVNPALSAYSAFLFDFNRTNGQITNPVPLLRENQHPGKVTFGIEFSANDSFIYLTTPLDWFSINSNNQIMQVERYASNIPATKVTLAQNIISYFLMLGQDNKIYFCHNYTEKLGVINNPDKKGTTCSLMLNSYNVLPNYTGSKISNNYYPFRKLSFEISKNLNNCYNDSVEFVNKSDIQFVYYKWIFGDGDSLIVPDRRKVKHLYVKEGKFNVRLYGQQDGINICALGDYYSDSVLIHLKPKAKIIQDSFKVLCEKQELFVRDTSKSLTSIWDWGDHSKSDSGRVLNHFYNSSGNFNVSLMSYSQFCSDTDSFSILVNINPSPVNKFVISDSVNCVPFLIRIIDYSLNCQIRYWDFGQGTGVTQRTETIPDTLYHLYNNSGKFLLKSVATNNQGCYDTSFQYISALDFPKSKFSFVTNTYCNYTRLTCTNQSQFADSFIWYLENETKTIKFKAKDSIVYLYTKSGNYKLSLIAKNQHCQDSIGSIVPITVKYRPIAEFNMLDSSGCQPLTSRFTDSSKFSINYSVFDFGDGTKDSVLAGGALQKTYTKAGSFKVSSKVFNSIPGCGDSVSKTIKVFKKPVKPVIISNSPLCEGLSLHLNAISDLGSTYLWEALNGYSSNQQNPDLPSIRLKDSGNYTVKSILNGCESDTATTKVVIYKKPVINIGKDTSVCSEEKILLDPGMFISYLWQDNSTNRTFELTEPGIYWTLVTDSQGCIASDSITVIKLCPSVLYIPNSFSPNGDGHNDYFEIISENVIESNLQIYNRWGVLVYQSNEINSKWDGKAKGADCMAGYYYLSLSVTFIEHKSNKYFLPLLLIR